MTSALSSVKRKRGRPSKLDREEMKELAQRDAPTMMAVLRGVATKSKSPSARVAAAVHILDRAYGKPALPIGQDPDLKSPFEDMMAAIKQKPIIGGK